ncbi:MAG: hypothetical protein AAGG02_18035 [Cyanobacteria bacterium P01_H01_bin.15]
MGILEGLVVIGVISVADEIVNGQLRMAEKLSDWFGQTMSREQSEAKPCGSDK